MVKKIIVGTLICFSLSASAQTTCGLGAQIMSYIVAGTLMTTCVTVPPVDYSREKFPSSWTERVTTQANLPKGVTPTEIKIDGEIGRTVKTAPVPAVEVSWWAKFKDALGNQYTRVVTSVSTVSSLFVKSPYHRVAIKIVEVALLELGKDWMGEHGLSPGSVISDTPNQVIPADTDKQNVPFADPAPAAAPAEAPGATGLNRPNPDKIYEKSNYGSGPTCAKNPAAVWPSSWLDWTKSYQYQTPGTTVNYYKTGNQVVEVTYKTGQPLPVPSAPAGYSQTAFNKSSTTYDSVLTRQVNCPVYKEIRQGDLYPKVAAQPDLVKAVAPKVGTYDRAVVSAPVPGDAIPVRWPFNEPAIDWPLMRAPWEPDPNAVDPTLPPADGGVTKPDAESSSLKLDFTDAFGNYGDPGLNPVLPNEVFTVNSIMGDRWSDGACPRPHVVEITLWGKQFSFSMDYQWICVLLAFVRPIFLAVGALLAIGIFVDALRGQ